MNIELDCIDFNFSVGDDIYVIRYRECDIDKPQSRKRGYNVELYKNDRIIKGWQTDSFANKSNASNIIKRHLNH